MMSMSGGWFFVVAAEAITVADQTISCPASAPTSRWRSSARLGAIGYAVGGMLVVILALRPVAVPAAACVGRQVPLEETGGEDARPWFLIGARTAPAVRIALARGLALAGCCPARS